MEDVRPRLGTTIDHERMRTELGALRDRLPEIRGTAKSGDGLIQATLGARGELLDLHLDSRVFGIHDAQALAADILDTVRQAAEAAAKEAYALSRSVLSDPDADRTFARTGIRKARP